MLDIFYTALKELEFLIEFEFILLGSPPRKPLRSILLPSLHLRNHIECVLWTDVDVVLADFVFIFNFLVSGTF